MKKKRLAIQAAKRKKKAEFKKELKALREQVFTGNYIPQEKLVEYRMAKDKLLKQWYPKQHESINA